MRLIVVVILASLACVACGTENPPRPLDCGVAPPLFDVRGDVVQGEGGSGCVRVERKPIGLGDHVICKACPYEVTRVLARLGDIGFDLRDDLSSKDRDDVGALTYEASHHNWADVVTAHGDGETVPTTFSLRIRYDVQGNGWDLEVLDIGDGTDGGNGDGNGDSNGDGNGDVEPLFVLPIVGSR